MVAVTGEFKRGLKCIDMDVFGCGCVFGSRSTPQKMLTGNAMIKNPYAKKTSSQQTESRSHQVTSVQVEPSKLNTVNPVDPLAGVSINHQPASFSQAFADVEAPDTSLEATASNLGSTSVVGEAQPSDNHALLGALSHVLYVSPRQKGNPILDHIRNVPWQYQTMAPDYIFNSTSCALFLSIKYHLLHPRYITERMAELHFKFQVLLVLVDAEDNAKPLLSLNTICVRHSFTLILAFSETEAARYLESFKALDGKDPASMVQRSNHSNTESAVDALSSIPKVNKQDATQLLSQMDSFRAISQATPDALALVAGLGEVKVQRIYDAFHKPFSKLAAAERKKQRQLESERDKNDDDELEDEKTGSTRTADDDGMAKLLAASGT